MLITDHQRVLRQSALGFHRTSLATSTTTDYPRRRPIIHPPSSEASNCSLHSSHSTTNVNSPPPQTLTSPASASSSFLLSHNSLTYLRLPVCNSHILDQQPVVTRSSHNPPADTSAFCTVLIPRHIRLADCLSLKPYILALCTASSFSPCLSKSNPASSGFSVGGLW